ncbi:hypothetical protein [Streptomyces sp. NPDC047718]|uniref:hypothetical protein n=1 Tax=Streptomyces sp. NPDC047718 TaxID=3155479 RepID=UPI0033E851BD
MATASVTITFTVPVVPVTCADSPAVLQAQGFNERPRQGLHPRLSFVIRPRQEVLDFCLAGRVAVRGVQ